MFPTPTTVHFTQIRFIYLSSLQANHSLKMGISTPPTCTDTPSSSASLPPPTLFHAVVKDVYGFPLRQSSGKHYNHLYFHNSASTLIPSKLGCRTEEKATTLHREGKALKKSSYSFLTYMLTRFYQLNIFMYILKKKPTKMQNRVFPGVKWALATWLCKEIQIIT